MQRADLNRPTPILVAPHGRAATVEALLTVEPEAAIAPGDLEEILDEIARRVDRALEGLFENLPAAVTVDDVGVVNPQHVPFFPATFGDRVYEDQVDVYEAVEGLRKGTPQEGLLFDSAGRAFEVVVWTSFRRERAKDRLVSELWTLDPLEAFLGERSDDAADQADESGSGQ